MSAKRLVDMLSSLKKLQRISFTIKDVRDFQTELDRNAGAQEALSSVKVMTVQVRNDPVQAQIMTMHFMAVTSFFEYCSSLEEFHVHGLFCTRGVPPYVVNPQIKKLSNLTRIHTMTINDALDPFARTFFFGALLEMCQLSEVSFRTLLQPLVVTEHLQRKDNFVTCMRRVEQLRNLDISQTVAAIPNSVYQLERATHLQYLNIADNPLVDSHSLHALADNCLLLASINLKDCHQLHTRPPSAEEANVRHVDLSGLQSLLVNCSHLQHINISGVHIHAKDISESGYTSLCHILAVNPHWRSISLSPCCLIAGQTGTGLSDVVGFSRAEDDSSNIGLAKRPRLGIQSPNLDASREQELTSELGKLVSACSHVEQFELIGAGFRSVFSKRRISDELKHFVSCTYAKGLTETDIICIRHWSNLRYLQLSAVSCIATGDCLSAIVLSCRRLQRLMVGHLGVSPMSGFQDRLGQALPFAHTLKDLRIEQTHAQLRDNFWQAMSQMTCLERLCIISKYAVFKKALIVDLMNKVTTLVVLQLYMNNSLQDCVQLQSCLVTESVEWLT